MLDRKLKTTNKVNLQLQPIPDKLYFSIGETGELCALKPHVLRYWEQEFVELKPIKKRGNRRYYQRKDLLLIRQIRSLLYEQGFTIEGAKAQLQKESNGASISNKNQEVLKFVAAKLEEIVKDL
ncbi:MAG: MerR family transcriptional regulator [Gammaproteobacteria bacterium]|nr:MerR family transcriptional regulator [Gammaproteobacteria bacterium]